MHALPCECAGSEIADLAPLQTKATAIYREETTNHVVSNEKKGRWLS